MCGNSNDSSRALTTLLAFLTASEQRGFHHSSGNRWNGAPGNVPVSTLSLFSLESGGFEAFRRMTTTPWVWA